jgi:hypothetical protein
MEIISAVFAGSVIREGFGKLYGKAKAINQVVVGQDTNEQLEEETLKLHHFLSLFPGDSWANKLSDRWVAAKPPREIAGKRSSSKSRGRRRDLIISDFL